MEVPRPECRASQRRFCSRATLGGRRAHNLVWAHPDRSEEYESPVSRANDGVERIQPEEFWFADPVRSAASARRRSSEYAISALS